MQRREGEAEGAPEAEGGAREGGGEEQAWAVTADEEVQRGAALRQPRRPRPAGVCPLRPAPLLTGCAGLLHCLGREVGWRGRMMAWWWAGGGVATDVDGAVAADGTELTAARQC